jgi:DNA repair protein RadC
MIDSNVARLRPDSQTTRRRAAKGHTVTRYRLHLVKEDQECIAEPEILIRPAEIAAFLWKRIFDGLDREVMCAVYVDLSRRVIGWTVAYVGCLSRCNVEPRGLVVPALLANASGLIIAHNHPTGSTEPSNEDRLFTRQLELACEVLRLNLIDSLIVAEGLSGPRWRSILSAVHG